MKQYIVEVSFGYSFITEAENGEAAYAMARAAAENEYGIDFAKYAEFELSNADEEETK